MLNLRKLSGAALLLALSLGIVAPAGAAEAPRDAASGQATGKRQHAPRDAASGQATGKRQHNPVVLISKYEEIEATLATLRTQIETLQAQCNELSSLATEEDAAMAEDSAAAEEMLAQLDNAMSIFDEQVASMLDAQLAEQVREALRIERGDRSMMIDDTGGSSSADVDALLDTLTALVDALPPIEVQAAQGKSTQVTRSNISNN
jgi:hypothetical protein